MNLLGLGNDRLNEEEEGKDVVVVEMLRFETLIEHITVFFWLELKICEME